MFIRDSVEAGYIVRLPDTPVLMQLSRLGQELQS